MSENRKTGQTNFTQRSYLLIAATILLGLFLGASSLVFSSPYAPIIVLGSIIAITSFFIWIKKPIWALYFAIFMVLLPTSLIPAQINSYMNRTAIVIAFLVWVLDLINRRSRINLVPTTLLLGVFIVWAAMSLMWTEDLSDGTNILQRYVLRFILFLILIINEVRTKKTFNGLMNILALSGGLLVIVSIVTVLKQGYSVGQRLQVLDVNENELGISLLITMPAVFWWSLRPANKPVSILKKLLATIFLFVSIGLIGLSGSRGSAISLGFMLIGFLLWKSTRFWGILGLLVIGIAILSIPILFTTTIDRFLGAPGETALGGREYIWPVAWLLIKDHLILGVGIGNSPNQIFPYLVNAGIMRLSLLSVSEISIHNPLLVIWAETGLLGLIIYLGILISAVIDFIRQYINSRNMKEGYLIPYFALVSSMFIGYIASWIKGGGMESDPSYFLVIALLIIPSQILLDKKE
jgi:putative inorganic carbon (hco3(-)) transporter